MGTETDPKQSLSNQDIATLTEIAEAEPSRSLADREPHAQESLERLLAAHYIEVSGESGDEADYKLTPEGQDFLTGRGAGLNEA